MIENMECYYLYDDTGTQWCLPADGDDQELVRKAEELRLRSRTFFRHSAVGKEVRFVRSVGVAK